MSELKYKRVMFLICPTGTFCREDRCQSFFDPKLIPSMRPPLEECEAAGAVKVLGGESQVVDAPAAGMSKNEVLARLQAFNPDLLIVSITFGTLIEDMKWVQELRNLYPLLPIGLRGAPCYTWSKKLLVQYPAATFCLLGDYEITISNVLRSGIERADGVSSRSQDGSISESQPVVVNDLDELPFPDRSSLNMKLYTVRGVGSPQATVRVQRGCPFPCSYCLVHTVSGNKARHRSPENIILEIRDIMAQGVTHFYFRAETFSVDRSWALAFTRKLAKECRGIRWVSTTRVECVDDELMAAFRDSGCYGLSFGIDVANSEIAKKVKKPLNFEHAKNAISLCNKYGIISLAYFMIGFVWDTRATLLDARGFISALRPDLLTIHYAHPYPGTDYYDEVAKEGLEIVSEKAQATPALHTSALNPQELQKFGNELLFRHYTRIAVLWSLVRKVFRLAFA